MNNPSELFLNPNFKADLFWRDLYKIRIGPVLPANKGQISRSIKDLSTESIRYRFLGSKKEFSPEELEYLTNIDGWNHYAIGMEEQKTPNRGIAIARLVRSLIDPGEAEIAITIIDEYHHMGLGTLLMRLIALAASERDIQRLSFSFLPQNEAIIKLIHKIGPTRTDSTAMDFVQLYMDMKDVDLNEIRSQLALVLPIIKNFQLK
jgi:RimJ/RimL family protein N-acetyltransferase